MRAARIPGTARRIFMILGLLLALTLTGTIGIRLTTGRDWFESAYLAIITLSTLGSRDVPEAGNRPAMLFVMIYIVVGLGIFTYSATQLGQLIVNAEFRRYWERLRMEKELLRLKDHSIVCGLGRMGIAICEQLAARDKPFVCVEQNADQVDRVCRDRGWLAIVGDATRDETLKQAGIERARALATTLPTNADNVYVVLTARLLAPRLQIVSRATDDDAVGKLQRAGATRVISPISSGGTKMARFMMNPNIEDFIEITSSGGRDLDLVDLTVTAESPFVNQSISATHLRERGVMVVGIRRATGDMLIPPANDTIIQQGDCLFLFGASSDISSLLGERR